MDENKPRRRWLSFGIRDLLWAMVVVGLAVGWRADRSRLSDCVQEISSMDQEMSSMRRGQLRMRALRDWFRDELEAERSAVGQAQQP